MKKYLCILIGILILQACNVQSDSKEEDYVFISVVEYNEAVYASWIGQIIGNTYGLGYEFKFIDEPGPDAFPYGYDFTIDDLRKHNGAYSDDDTDIEYMYLTQMEKNGIEPSYYHLAEAWKTHVKEGVWFANRMAVNLMNAGHYPPVTGSIGFNSEWFQIDPQLVNEIWAITAPGMLSYALGKTEYAARITSDDFGIEPALHYAAMYSAAFFEKDIEKLIHIGLSALGEESKFRSTVKYVIQLYKQLPNDWQEARRLVKEKYYVTEGYNSHSWAVVDANLNGALGIMALLYGEGDFQKTLDYACAFGMDADNQAATMCGLLGIVNGFDAIPNGLMFPLEDLNWEKPFNDSYKMITREGLDDVKISALAERTAAQGERVILAHGGERLMVDGEECYKIFSNALFVPHFELNKIPDLVTLVNKPFYYPLYTGRKSPELSIYTEGELPMGLEVSEVAIDGIPEVPGFYSFTIFAESDGEKLSIPVNIKVHSVNYAPLASQVIFNRNAIDQRIEVIRNGKIKKTYFSTKTGKTQEIDFYGYIWEDELEISALTYNVGARNEFGAWFTSFDVEYLDKGKWVKISDFTMIPEMDLNNSQWMKPAFMDYEITFPSIRTKGIRIIGKSGGIQKDAANKDLRIEYFTSISELSVWN